MEQKYSVRYEWNVLSKDECCKATFARMPRYSADQLGQNHFLIREKGKNSLRIIAHSHNQNKTKHHDV